jgi:hypothetical protein
MKFSTNRQIKKYTAGDEVTVQISEIRETANGHINMKLLIMDGNTPSSVFFYQTIGDPLGKGRYYFESFMDAVGIPEGLEIDLPYFNGKKFRCVLGENTYNDKTNLTVATYIKADGDEVDVKDQPVIGLPPLTNDVEFVPSAKGKKGKGKVEDLKTVESLSPVRVDLATMLADE